MLAPRAPWSILFCAAMVCSGCDSYWRMKGFARIEPSAFAHVTMPFIVCSGHGGPAERSEGRDAIYVYGQILFRETYGDAEVFCSPPESASVWFYEEGVIMGAVPRKLHAYVWLEPRPELAARCASEGKPVIHVDAGSMLNATSSIPLERPCGRVIDPEGSVGFAVGFDRSSPDVDDDGDLEVLPNGYRRHREPTLVEITRPP